MERQSETGERKWKRKLKKGKRKEEKSGEKRHRDQLKPTSTAGAPS